jgi:hypothetical protein
VDEVSFRSTGLLPDGKPKPGGGTYLFRVYAAMAYDNGFPELVRLQAFLGNTTPEWTRFFGSLDGAPDRLVGDGHPAIAKAALQGARQRAARALPTGVASISATNGRPSIPTPPQ